MPVDLYDAACVQYEVNKASWMKIVADAQRSRRMLEAVGEEDDDDGVEDDEAGDSEDEDADAEESEDEVPELPRRRSRRSSRACRSACCRRAAISPLSANGSANPSTRAVCSHLHLPRRLPHDQKTKPAMCLSSA